VRKKKEIGGGGAEGGRDLGGKGDREGNGEHDQIFGL
jgi:hypothetical protein